MQILMYILIWVVLKSIRIYQSFIYSPTDALVSCLKKNIRIYIKIYIKTAVLM